MVAAARRARSLVVAEVVMKAVMVAVARRSRSLAVVEVVVKAVKAPEAALVATREAAVAAKPKAKVETVEVLA